MVGDKGVDEVLSRCTPEVRLLVESLRGLVRSAAPEAVEKGHTGWGNLVYERSGMFCYIAPLKDSVNLGFHRGVELADPEGLLRGTGKGMRHVKVRTPEDIRTEEFHDLIEQAYELDTGQDAPQR